MVVKVDMFFWMSALQNQLVQNNFNIFLDEWKGVWVLAGVRARMRRNYLSFRS